MGIVAFCPQGHRVNVKESFAGKKGLCPTCGAKFRIPAAASALPTARLLEVDPAVIATLPRVLPHEISPATSAPAARPGPGSAAVEPPARPEPPVAQPPAPITMRPALHPVLADRPDLQWCIAFPGGEPTEPLPAESMQAWLDAGQAEGTEVVWRSDWPEWLPARDVFGDVLT